MLQQRQTTSTHMLWLQVHNFPAVDALSQPSSLYQMTIAQKRNINVPGLVRESWARARGVLCLGMCTVCLFGCVWFQGGGGGGCQLACGQDDCVPLVPTSLS